MLNSQGLGEQVQRKKEAYQSNPQALQQQYQQSQQLVDLLALQQLKTEKEAAARNMKMQMQQNPATIAQQREQEVLGMIKQEQGRKLGDVAQRTAGTLGQINKTAQQNIQRTAKQGLPSLGGPQRPPANAPQKPAMMAGGGIVAFQEGGKVTAEELKSMGVTPETFSRMSEANKIQLIQAINDSRSLRMAGGLAAALPAGISDAVMSAPRLGYNALEALRTSRVGKALGASEIGEEGDYSDLSQGVGGVADYILENKGDVTREQIEAALGGPPETELSAEPTGRTIPDMGGMGVLAPQPPPAKSDTTQRQGLEALGLAPPKSPPTVVGTERQGIARTLIDEMGIKPEGTREEAREAAENRTKGILDTAIGREEGKLGPKESQLQRMQKLQEQQNDPEKLRRERIQRGLIGMTGRSADTMFGGYAAGKFNERRVQETAARKNLTDQFGIENEKIQLDLDIASAQITSGQEAVEVLAKDQRAAAAAVQSAAADDVRMAIAAGDRAFESNLQGAKTKLELFLNQMEDRRAAADQAADKELAYTQLAAEFILAKMEIEKDIMGKAGFDMANNPDEVTAAVNRLNLMSVQFHQMLENGNINAFEEDLKERIGASVGGGTSGGGTPSGIDVSTDLQAIIKGLQ